MVRSLKFKKEVSRLETVALDFVFLVLKLYTIRCHLTSIMDKSQHGPFIALFFIATSAAFFATLEVP